ncbi:MAG: L,D-transpeptidase [Pseudomonadota bacterium]
MTFAGSIKRLTAGTALMFLAACAQEELVGGVPISQIVDGYGVLEDGDYVLPPVPPEFLTGVNQRTIVEYNGPEDPGTIVVDPHAKLLYWVEEDGIARRYPIAVGVDGLRMRAPSVIRLKREWPGWTPTANMIAREPDIYGPFASGIEGGLSSPLGARALYLFQNGRDTHFRIHGTNDLASIGNSGSAGCIRMFNHDIIDLFERVPLDTRVVVRTYDQSVELEGEELANRGITLEPRAVDPADIYGPDWDKDGDGVVDEDVLNAAEEAEEDIAEADAEDTEPEEEA